jgi:hypothetical protein
MNVVGNYALVRDVCAALQARRVVTSRHRGVYGMCKEGSAALFVVASTKEGARRSSVHLDAYEAAAEFVRGLNPMAKVEVVG